MTKVANHEAAKLTDVRVEALLDAFIKTIPPHTYRSTDLPTDGPAAEIADLSLADIRVFIVHLAERITSLRLRHNAFVHDPKRPYAESPWVKEQGTALSMCMSRLLLRAHDFAPSDILALIRSAHAPSDTYPLCLFTPTLVKTIERFAAAAPIPSDVRSAVAAFAEFLHKSRNRDSVLLAGRLDRVLNPNAPASATGTINYWERFFLDRADFEPRTPSLADAYLAAITIPAPDDAAGAIAFGAIEYTPAPEPSVLATINASLAAAQAVYRDREYPSAPTEFRSAGITAVSAMFAAVFAMGARPIRYEFHGLRAQRFHNGCRQLLLHAAEMLADLREADVSALAHIATSISRFRPPEYIYISWSEIASRLTRLLAPHIESLSDEHAFAFIRLREWLARTANDRNAARFIDETLRIRADLPIELGEPWADRAFQDIKSAPDDQRAMWTAILELASQAKGAAPTAKWLKSANAAIVALPRENVEEILASWLALVGKPRPALAGGKIPGRDPSIPSDSSADTLRGLAFLASRFDTPAMARALGDLAMACFKMVPGHGARCIKPGSSALWSLAQMSTPSALAQLSRLRQLVKFGTAKKMLDTSLENLATKLGITTEELHEIAAPDFGLSADSTITEDAGDFTLVLIADPQGARIRVLDETGKERKTVPDAIKKDHADIFKSLKQAKDDIDKMLEAQRARIDALFIADRTWPVPAWRERYIDHPLVGVLGRRLIWRVIDDPKTAASDTGTPVLYLPDTGSFADIEGNPITPGATQHIKLWHPIFATADQVRRWRDRIESLSIRQPVKQAHREVYPLTDAERRTATYSNRFAAHIIKQHAFQQLAADRSWTSKLRLMVDAEYPPPTRSLPSWALRAEFWIESIGDNFGTDTTESGSYLHLATDQVRFYRDGAARAYAHAGGGGYTTQGLEAPENLPLPLDQIPPLVFSEIMRDVDLFIAGASIGNNADWQDGGPEGRFRDYWQSYSFGDLGASGKARREFLEKLIPRLKIAPLCSFEDKFLIVKGTLRTYKIHLGSGNILMKPNDQYLCIVPSSSFTSDSGPGGVFLPFDGDRTLSIILSKAFMLAEDTKIKDTSITTQIKRA